MISFICGIQKQNKNRLVETEDKLVVATGRQSKGLGEKGEGGYSQ